MNASISWPALEGLAAYLFVIAVTWGAPGGAGLSGWGLSGLVAAGLGGAVIASAYWRERTRERQQPWLHGVGTGLIAMGTLGVVLATVT